MDKSDSIKELAAAMAIAQPKIEGARKDKNNPAFRSKYADLSSVAEAITPIYEHGLSFSQFSHDRDNAAAIETIILHKSGEWMSAGIVSVPVTKHDAHGFGSALTYARRYSLGAAFGVVPEDDDGNAAANAAPAAKAADSKRHVTPTEAQEKQAADYCAALETAATTESLRVAFERAEADVGKWDLPMMVNLITAAKNKRYRELNPK